MSEPSKAPQADEKPRPIPDERIEITVHKTRIAGRELAYTATAGTVHLEGEGDEPRASMFYVAYTADREATERPITFAFNGGPGSSAVWLHLGTLGPRRVDVPDAVAPPPPPYDLVDNADGILDVTDLVFVDPIGTGFSRAVGAAEEKEWFEVEKDVASVVEFIRRFLQRTGRWNSPRFLAGESYGTTRAASIAEALQTQGLMLNGLVLLSPALSFRNFVFEHGADLPYLLFMPTYAAVAWYHDRLPRRPPALGPFLDEVRAWCVDTYAPALVRGASLDPAAARAVAEALHGYTGVPVDTLLAAELRVADMHFAKMALGEPGQVVGRLDGRYTGPDSAPLAHRAERDPSFDGPMGPYTGMLNHYLRRTLGFDPPEEYRIFSFAANEGWRWQDHTLHGLPDVADALRKVMLQNPHLRVLVGNGYYDLATPFFAAEYSVDHLGLDRSVRDNVELTYYEAGHMMYLHPPSRARLRADLVAFYHRSLKRKTADS